MAEEASGKPRRVLVFRALQLGDMLCAVPALRALRAGFPEAEITLAGLPWATEFARRFAHLADRFEVFPGHPGLPEQPCDPRAASDFARRMRARGFDLAIQMHGSGRITNAVVGEFGAREMAGFYPPGTASPGRWFLPWQGRHEIRQLLDLTGHLGLPSRGDGLEFPLTAEDVRAGASLRRRYRVGAPYAVIHPGSQLPSRRWLPERFASVGAHLQRRGFDIVITGSASERPLGLDVASRLPRLPVLLAGETSLGALGAVVAGAALVVSNDTGISHIAAALETPSVIIACGSDVTRWRPLDTRLHQVVAAPVDCRPCTYVTCPIGHPCATGVGVDSVLAAVDDVLLQGGGSRDSIEQVTIDHGGHFAD
jgi:ADP-heptose:LPS heptosyltransferase